MRVLLYHSSPTYEMAPIACGVWPLLHIFLSPDDSAQHASNKLEQVQQRLLAYTEDWPQLRRWYAKQRLVRNIDANQDLDTVCNSASEKIQEVTNMVGLKLWGRGIFELLFCVQLP